MSHKPVDLARELIWLREAAKESPAVTIRAASTTEEYILFVAKNGPRIAQALLDAEQKPQISVEAAVAGYPEIVMNQDKRIVELEAKLKRYDELNFTPMFETIEMQSAYIKDLYSKLAECAAALEKALEEGIDTSTDGGRAYICEALARVKGEAK